MNSIKNEKILVVDDEKGMREFLEIMLKKEGYKIECAVDGHEAINKLNNGSYDMVITDILMPNIGGFEILKKAKDIYSDIIVVMITAFGSTESAVEAMKMGAYDYILKPFKVDEIRLIVKEALEKRELKKENIRLKRELKIKYQYDNLIGSSPEMLKIYNLIDRVKETKTNVLILGESGTGKEMVARAIHYNSPRKENPFVTINCSAIPEGLMESELFGHKKGSFTGAISDKVGLFEFANGGTVFLDEIGELIPPVQVKLLRVLQERVIRRIGDNADKEIDVRIISATNRNLEEEVTRDRFREDLFYRLNVIQISVPPLRARKDDIQLLAEHFLGKYSKELGKDIKKISVKAMNYLMDYHYPGNVRELENIIERAVALETTNAILPENLPPSVLNRRYDAQKMSPLSIPPEGLDLENAVAVIETSLLKDALRMANGVKKRAAKILNISFRSFRYRLAKYGIEAKEDGDFIEDEEK